MSVDRGALKQQYITIVLLLILTAHCAHANRHLSLPHMGDPSYSAMSHAEEKKIGRVILAQLRSSLVQVEDIELQSYLQSLSQKLLAQIGTQGLNFHFLIAKDDTINAFATPGGVIVINSGMILFADHEDELAGVIAHELAHVSHRHIARLYDLSEQTQWVGALQLIAGLIAGTYNPEFVQLGVVSAVSSVVERQLFYSRAFEREADYSGMHLLSQAGYDPDGMVRFFAKLQARGSNNRTLPEFLRTHPLDKSRLKDMQERVRQYPAVKQRDDTAFQYAKARLHAISGLADQADNKQPQHIDLYRKGIDLMQKNFPYRAIRTLQQIAPAHRDDTAVRLALAQSYRLQNNYKKAEEILKALLYPKPNNPDVNYQLAKLYLSTDRPQQALTLLQNITTLHSRYPILIKMSAQALALLKRQGQSHEYLSEYYALIGNFNLALKHLDLADKSPEINKVSKARTAQKRTAILHLQEEMQER